MEGAQRRLDIAAENLANLSTDGFHTVLARGALTARGVRITRERAARAGALRHTGAPFDLAIVGAGSFRVRDAVGRVRATRDGSFRRDRFGALRTASDEVLLGDRGIVRVPLGAEIGDDGHVRFGGRIVATIPLAPGSTLRAGWIEGTGVDAPSQMIDILWAQRSFEAAQHAVTAIDRTRRQSATEVGKPA